MQGEAATNRWPGSRMNRPLACKARGMQLVLIAFYVISGLLRGRVKCIAVKGEIASARFQARALPYFLI